MILSHFICVCSVLLAHGIGNFAHINKGEQWAGRAWVHRMQDSEQKGGPLRIRFRDKMFSLHYFLVGNNVRKWTIYPSVDDRRWTGLGFQLHFCSGNSRKAFSLESSAPTLSSLPIPFLHWCLRWESKRRHRERSPLIPDSLSYNLSTCWRACFVDAGRDTVSAPLKKFCWNPPLTYECLLLSQPRSNMKWHWGVNKVVK